MLAEDQQAYILVTKSNQAWPSYGKVFITEQRAKTFFSQSNTDRVLFKNQSDVRIEPLIPRFMVEDALKLIEEANRDNQALTIDNVIEMLREKMR